MNLTVGEKKQSQVGVIDEYKDAQRNARKKGFQKLLNVQDFDAAVVTPPLTPRH